jgi:imidazolonepropionase-like amidohydrolase
LWLEYRWHQAGKAAVQPLPVGRSRNVTLIDVDHGAQEAAMTVVTKDGQILDIGRGISVPRGAVRVDGTGKFLIPGLWDMHSHHQATGAESLDLFLPNGVVGTRDMGSDVL